MKCRAKPFFFSRSEWNWKKVFNSLYNCGLFLQQKHATVQMQNFLLLVPLCPTNNYKKTSLSRLERMQRYMSGFLVSFCSYVSISETRHILFHLRQPWQIIFEKVCVEYDKNERKF